MNLMSKQQQKRFKSIWKNFVASGQVTGEMRPSVALAWERCKKMGVNPFRNEPDVITDAEKINEIKARNQALLTVSAPAIQQLYDTIAGNELFLSISDMNGVLIIVHSDDPAIQPEGLLYSEWSEEKMGNNPIGTSLFDGKSHYVYGYEHYCIYPHYYSGVGSPIRDPDDKIIGAISITGKTPMLINNAMGLLIMTAYSIERELRILRNIETIDKAYAHRNHILNSMSEAILVINKHGQIVLGNPIATKLLQFPNEDAMVGLSLSEFSSDPFLLNTLETRNKVSDYVTNILVKGKNLICTISFTPLQEDDGLFVFNEISRAEKLAAKIIRKQSIMTFDDFVGNNQQLHTMISKAKRIALTDSNVLITGESGTGKDILAQAIHSASARKNGPFLAINCGSFTHDLIQSELFGYVEGAFTGAKRGGEPGKFQLASGGTLFLDEVAELPIDLQATLLRAIENKSITPVGGKESVTVNVRIIAATNKDLVQCIQQQTFRADLYYRLNVLHLSLNPLRERKDDIPMLSEMILSRLRLKYGKHIHSITPPAMKGLMALDWPGNVRELQNVLERAYVLAEHDFLDSADFDWEQDDMHPVEIPQIVVGEDQRERIIEALRRNRWNKSKAADELAVSRSTLYRLLREHGI